MIISSWVKCFIVEVSKLAGDLFLKVGMKHNIFISNDMHVIEYKSTGKLHLFESNQPMHSRAGTSQILYFYNSTSEMFRETATCQAFSKYGAPDGGTDK